MNSQFKYLPPDQRRRILLICDDIRVHSGIATVAREIVLHTCQHFNWVNIGGAIQHPEAGKRLDLSADTNSNSGLTDSNVTLYPVNGYGDPTLLRTLIQIEKPDAIFIITDPRYFIWLFQMESELRKKLPIIYLNIWDDYPAPHYNKAFYEACDALLGISKQTVNINQLVLGEKAKNKIIKYVPHGLNHEMMFPIDEKHAQYNDMLEFKKQVFGGKDYEFVVFFNSRNIRRKQIPDTMLAYKFFIDQLPKEQAKKCAFLLHTQIVDDNGTDLEAVRELLLNGDEYNIIYSEHRLGPQQMNWLYNCADVGLLISSNEGWGLSLTEAMMAGRPIIAVELNLRRQKSARNSRI